MSATPPLPPVPTFAAALAAVALAYLLSWVLS